MFNIDLHYKTKYPALKPKAVLFFKYPNRSLVTRFNNFVFGTFHLNKKLIFWKSYKCITSAKNFTSRKAIIGFKICKFHRMRDFSWKFEYLWDLLYFEDEDGVRYTIYKTKRYRGKFGFMRNRCYRYRRRWSLLDKGKGMSFRYVNKTMTSLLMNQRGFFKFSNRVRSKVYRSMKSIFRYKRIYFIMIGTVWRNNRKVFLNENSYIGGTKIKQNMDLIVNSNQTMLILSRFRRMTVRSFYDLLPNYHIHKLLVMGKNRISPFSIKNKTFVSQREVHYSSICFFIEKSNFTYKNSYFLGLVINGGKRKPHIMDKAFRIVSYRFSKNPYSLTNGSSWL